MSYIIDKKMLYGKNFFAIRVEKSQETTVWMKK